jgi:hypothetical protein
MGVLDTSGRRMVALDCGGTSLAVVVLVLALA